MSLQNQTNRKSKCLSIVVPCYNEEEVISETIKRLLDIEKDLGGIRLELLFVDDGSADRTRAIIAAKAHENSKIRLLSFSRNFGHQVAVTAGVDHATGDAIVLIDADLQDPPDVIIQMVGKWQEGYDVVYGQRIERQGESVFKKKTAELYYSILQKMSYIEIPLNTGDFRLISRRVAESLKNMPEKDRYIRGMVSWVGFKQTALPYKRAKRFAGVSKYPLRKMVYFATDGLLSFSIKPLQISTFFGLIAAFVAFVGIIYALGVKLLTDNWVEGWTTIFIAVLFLGGTQLISIGILGEYLGRVYSESKRRPLYFVNHEASVLPETRHGAYAASDVPPKLSQQGHAELD